MSNRGARQRVIDLQAGDRVDDEIYLVAQKDLRTTNSGGLYIHAVLADSSGQMLARLWSATQELYDSIPAGGLVYVRGRAESYKGKLQFIIDGVRAVESGKIDPSEFLPHTPHDVGQMWQRLREILATIEHPDVKALIDEFLNDEDFANRFRRAPAARTNHHAYVGGLLEHTLGLLELALVVLPRYPDVSRDLVLAGLLLHDCGKTVELGYRTSFEYTTSGQLLGHLVQAAIWTHEKARRLQERTQRPIPAEILTALEHIIISHHGRYEYGSPKLPATPEAILVHYLDNLDAKLNMAFQAIDSDPDESAEWTAWVSALETRIYKVDVLKRRST